MNSWQLQNIPTYELAYHILHQHSSIMVPKSSTGRLNAQLVLQSALPFVHLCSAFIVIVIAILLIRKVQMERMAAHSKANTWITYWAMRRQR